jgi:tetratricopeptide (TPR) repeat protein
MQEAREHLHSLKAQVPQQELRIARIEGEILTEAGHYQEAMKVYDQALGDRYDSELLYTRAMLAEKMGRLTILERDLRRILEREPDNVQTLNALGYTLADRTDRHQEAYTLIKRALELSPNDFYILDSMGWVLYRLGRLQEAVQYLRKAQRIRNDPEVAAHPGAAGAEVIASELDGSR